MNKNIKRTVAVIGAAAITAMSAVPASASGRGCKGLQTFLGNSSCSSCPSGSSIDIWSILNKYINCGQNSGSCQQTPSAKPDCSNGSCQQTPSAKPDCSNGSCQQTPSAKPDCSNGSCQQTPSAKPDCPSGSCQQTPSAKPECPSGSCQQSPSTKPDCPSGSCQQAPSAKPECPNGSCQQDAEEYTVSEYEKEVVRLVNDIRAENGLSKLTINTKLSQVARIKAEDMRDNRYFSHTSPTYGSPFDMMKSYGISYRYAGENIASGQRTPEEVVRAWMNSAGHKANILNSSFKEIGMGYANNGNYWAQMFIG